MSEFLVRAWISGESGNTISKGQKIKDAMQDGHKESHGQEEGVGVAEHSLNKGIFSR